ncbi:MAG: hypothetical protein ACRBBR_13925 [Cellvibrionaceae bacterium]
MGDGPNTYLYSQANPLKYSDPTGESAIAEGVAVGAVSLCVRFPRGCASAIIKVSGAISSLSSMFNEVPHPEEQELLEATCDDASWAIPELESLIKSRERQYKASGGSNININPSGPGHIKRIKKLKAKLKGLKECPKDCP